MHDRLTCSKTKCSDHHADGFPVTEPLCIQPEEDSQGQNVYFWTFIAFQSSNFPSVPQPSVWPGEGTKERVDDRNAVVSSGSF